MGTNTTKLGLLKPSENDFYNQQTEQADNWEKVDKFADDIQNLVDNNGGKKITGYIQDGGEKVLGNYYLDKLTTGLFRCIKSGNINYNSSEYFVDYSNYATGDKLRNLIKRYNVGNFSNGNLGRIVNIPMNIVSSNVLSMTVVIGTGTGNRHVFTSSRFHFVEHMFSQQVGNPQKPVDFDGIRVLSQQADGSISIDSATTTSKVIMAVEITYI